MEVWISGTIDEVKMAVDTGLVGAVATNPTLIASWTQDGRTLEEVVTEVCEKVDVPVYVQLHGPDVDSFLAEMEALSHISHQIFPKLIATHDGIAAAARLVKEGLKPLVTAVCSVNQAFLAAAAGATYIAPYVGRIQDAGQDAYGLIENTARLYAMNNVQTQIVAASIRTPEQATKSLLAGARATVVFYDVFRQLFEDELTHASIDGFERDWEQFTFEARADVEPSDA